MNCMCDRVGNLKCVGTFLVILLSLGLFFKFGPKIPISVTSQQRGDSFTTSGTGKVTVVPDIAKVTLGIEETGVSLKEVQNKVNQKSQNLTATIKKLGIRETNIKTLSYHVYPDYDYRITPQKITGYQVSLRYEVKVEDFEKVNDLLVKATEVGANTIGNISFEVNKKTKKEKLQEAREEAVKEAKEKAEGLARAAGIGLGKIINLSESQDYPSRLYALPVAGGGDAKTEVAPDIAPGETELTVTVSLSFEIR